MMYLEQTGLKNANVFSHERGRLLRNLLQNRPQPKSLLYRPTIRHGSWRSLELITCQLGPSGAKALADCPRLESLVHLDLLDNYIGDEGMAALAASPYLSALRSLRIDLNDLGPAGVEALARSASLGGLEDLFLGDWIGPAAAVSLGRSPYLTNLRGLSLHDIGDLGTAGP